MKMGRFRAKKGRRAAAATIIGGADGPTSVFLVGNAAGRKPLKVQAWQLVYRCRGRMAEKRIRANPHTLKQVVKYVRKKYHAVEIPGTKRIYLEQYASVKEGLILKHKPELLGELAKNPHPDELDERSVKEMFRQIQLRSEKAAAVPGHEMPMDFHLYRIRIEGGQMEIQADFRWDMLEISYSGNKKAMRQLKKISREIYLYYGVSEEDIINHSERYSALLAMLSS